jgi:hypothetical protein
VGSWTEDTEAKGPGCEVVQMLYASECSEIPVDNDTAFEATRTSNTKMGRRTTTTGVN